MKQNQGNGEKEGNEAVWPAVRGGGGFTHQTCSLIFFPSISTVRILKSIPRSRAHTFKLRLCADTESV